MKSKLLQHLSFISCDKDAAIMQHVWKMWLIIRQQPSAAIMFFVFVLFCCFFFYIKKKGKTYISYSSVKILWFEVLTMPFLVKYQLLCFFCNKFSEAKKKSTIDLQSFGHCDVSCDFDMWNWFQEKLSVKYVHWLL